MKEKINNLDNKTLKEITLDKSVFGVEVKEEIIHRMIRYQLSKKRSGNHKTKGISEISGTTKKPFKQKGTGSARQGSKRSPQMRGGAVIFGPLVRSHEHKLPKKIKKLALKMALSKKLKDGKLKILSELKISQPKTSLFRNKLTNLKVDSALFIDNIDVDKNFFLASKNVPKIDVLPLMGLNVYDILKRDYLIFSESAVSRIQERLSK
ncbi:MAG: 50S ribosomal protein L4 [Pelagibacteraceae bacterium TMED65]|nr:50S ribosomal protein L4 [Rickettsiales bacterium]OUU50268.1 MAG: 50S ribosomal protein L4 [Pelagibacteraceae bacterium TMED65]|tara:strand:+ start:160 stop:783 length:624 start_codon:yes stop_codon:yes gene_type:complete